MTLLLITLTLLAMATVARLATVLHTDRPVAPPRSHFHELDPAAARLR